MRLDERLLAVIEIMYDAALDQTLWPRALQVLTDYTGSQAATFWTLDGSPQPTLPLLITYNFDPAFMREYLNGMVPEDPTVQYLVRHPKQPIVHDGLFITEREKDRLLYYDWHGRNSDTRYRMVGQARPAGGVQAGVALHRTRRAGRFEPRDLERFAFIYNHLARALAIGVRLGSLGALQQCTASVLDSNPAAILFLNSERRIVYANRSAEGLRAGSDGIRLANDRLVIAHRADQTQLNALIASIVRGSKAMTGRGGLMRVIRPSGKRPYAVLVTPAGGNFPALAELRPSVLVVITDPDAVSPLPKDRLRSAFLLTDAEAQLAALIAAGDELRVAATKLGIQYGTARVRLAQIFQKTETRRQGELVRVLLATLAMP
jgi:DNA-binding CsgD family transcriptional regulator/PAS domain-containing protein